jgi:predicted regulator of Ras-like GTPase activity (Roadblock/LC7/MglB family)
VGEDVRIDLGALRQLAGFQGAAVVDSETGLVLGSASPDGRDLETAAAASMDVVRAARGMVHALEMDDDVEDVMVSLGAQYHLARTVAKSPAIFLYCALDRRTANLGVARITLKHVEEAIEI